MQVVYGVVGYKTHAKMLLIVRREGRAAPLRATWAPATTISGTARAYTDIGLITADPDIGADVHLLFQQLSGLAPRPAQAPAAVAVHPASPPAREDRTRGQAREGRQAGAHHRQDECDQRAAASSARTAPRRPGVQGRPDRARRLLPCVPACRVSDNIRVRSIVGRFLEHSRVYWLATTAGIVLRQRRLARAQPAPDRNLLPHPRSRARRRVKSETLQNWPTTSGVWELQADGEYRQAGDRPPPGRARIRQSRPR